MPGTARAGRARAPRYQPHRRERHRLLVDAFEGEPLNSPNDLVVASDGGIWFTDPTYGISDPREGYPADPALPHQSVYRWRDGDGLQRMIDLDQPNGLAFSRDEKTLYVAESNAERLPRIVACDWDGETLGAPRTFATVDAGIPTASSSTAATGSGSR